MRTVTRPRPSWRLAGSVRPLTSITVLVVLLAVTVLVGPLPGEAQQPANLPRIGFLFSTSESDPRIPPYLQAFRQGLREAGYVEGQNIAIVFRGPTGKTTVYPASRPSCSGSR